MSENEKNSPPRGTWATQHTLLKRIQVGKSEQDWEDFVVYYQPFIRGVIYRASSPSAAEAEDLAQEVLIKLFKHLSSYDSSKGKFRSWLAQIVRNSIYTRHQKQSDDRKNVPIVDGGEEHFSSPNPLDLQIEQDWKDHICHLAMERLESVFSPKAIELFKLSLEGLSGPELTERTGLKQQSIYVMKSRVKKRFIQETQELMRELEG
jgi:RNA polymerase sigma-70 factor (ECF subfamily)